MKYAVGFVLAAAVCAYAVVVVLASDIAGRIARAASSNEWGY